MSFTRLWLHGVSGDFQSWYFLDLFNHSWSRSAASFLLALVILPATSFLLYKETRVCRLFYGRRLFLRYLVLLYGVIIN